MGGRTEETQNARGAEREGRENAEVENETGEHTAASSSSVRPGSPSALQLNPTPLRPSGALRLRSFSSGISLNGSRNLERIPDPTALVHPPPVLPVLLPFLLFLSSLSVRLSVSLLQPSRIKTSGFASFSPSLAFPSTFLISLAPLSHFLFRLLLDFVKMEKSLDV